jgi:hypothetical protein
MQPGRLGDSDNWRPADVPSNVNPKTAKTAGGDYLQTLHGQQYEPAIDAAGNADCQRGQNGYPTGPFPPGAGRYPPHAESGFQPDNPNDPFYRDYAGGSHVIQLSDMPGLAGTTYWGVPNLRDVP